MYNDQEQKQAKKHLLNLNQPVIIDNIIDYNSDKDSVKNIEQSIKTNNLSFSNTEIIYTENNHPSPTNTIMVHTEDNDSTITTIEQDAQSIDSGCFDMEPDYESGTYRIIPYKNPDYKIITEKNEYYNEIAKQYDEYCFANKLINFVGPYSNGICIFCYKNMLDQWINNKEYITGCNYCGRSLCD